MIQINPASPNRMGMISRYSPISLPIGVGLLAGYLLSKGVKVKIVDELIKPIDDNLNGIDNLVKTLEKPYIFGISCLTINVGRGYKIARLFKERYPDSVIILGGIHPTVLPEEALGTGYVDIVVRGEGEETLFQLYNAIKDNRGYNDIEGISFAKNGNLQHNPARSLVNDIDNISFFPYEMFDESKYNMDFVMTSRGCPYDCIFCSQRKISGRRYRFRSPEKVIQELDLLINKYNQQSIAFLDDDFLVNKKRAKVLCEMIIENRFNTKVKFSCQARADNVEEEILGYLKEAGFSFIGLGFETSSERLMRLINKKEKVTDNVRAVRIIKRMGLRVNASFLFALPSETDEERFETYMLAKELRIDYAKFNNVVPYPGTQLYNIAKKEGRLSISEDWNNFNSVEGVVEGVFSKSRLPYVPVNTTEKELRRDMVRANLYFYLNNLISLFTPKKGNPGWFLLPKRWYFSPKEIYHLTKLAIKVLINCIVVFDLKWFVKGITRRFRQEQLSKLVKDASL